ncbi:unnamed protein product [Malassezia sympodialis ATCC 42132]|uniref:uncharacterized protein n=1 Tax=Malassezia sympodialis (strain ATCC 42132) TaxID=1230383 RepID=UPI0002C2AD31|nr:uncharacterized protein MSY001_1569 [Malassezia sympodialis ATCC 42132]CCU98863.1 unnamed protein product [Malassezia sympodialis ATCC 42132]|eukprot:XP_018740144.1 uncharacterized protein MSY001_1569 [Malassezia sympodialis ATCC 42132]
MAAPDAASGVRAAAREALEVNVYQDPRISAPWLDLLALVRQGENVDDVRDVYDRFFEYFPQASTQWMDYIDWELSRSNFEQVNAIFTRCLRNTMSVDLWKMYLAYTRRVRRVLEQAYEFALKYIGWDRESSPIWQDYLQLLREREARGTWQEGQKMDQLRRVFQRAVMIPLNQVEAIWREYDAYETSLNKITAKKFLGERSPAYMQARTVLKELRNLTDNLVRPDLPVQPCWIVPNGKTPAKERQSLQGWRRYLEWEEKNPLAIEDPSLLQHRVLSAYKKATMYVRFDAVVWYMAAMYCQSVHRDAEALVWLHEGTEACPWSMLLRFQYAELARAQGKDQDASAALDDLLMYMHHQIDTRLEAQRAACAAVDAETDAEREAALQRRAQDDAPDDDDADKAALADIERRIQETREQRHAKVLADARPGLDEWREALSQVWIKYMQLVRRAEGIRPARQVFARARKSPHCTWQVYEANAMLEYHCSKDTTVATKVFELALKVFGPDEHLVVRYLDFLISINDDTNARAVLERTVSSMPVDKAKSVWMRWAEYEYSYGDTSAMARLDARLADVYPDVSRLDRAADRWRYGTLDYVRAKDLGYSRIAAPAAKEAKEAPADEPAADAAKASQNKAPAPEPAPKVETGGRQSMEEIRRALATSSEPVKRTRPKAEPEKSSKKRKDTAVSEAARRPARDTPPPVPVLPDAVMYFMRCVLSTDPVFFRRP